MTLPEITIPATEAKNRFGELLEIVHREPVGISKKGRPVAVVLSIEEYTSILEKLAESKSPLDLLWLDEWMIRMDGRRETEVMDEADYYRHLDQKYGESSTCLRVSPRRF